MCRLLAPDPAGDEAWRSVPHCTSLATLMIETEYPSYLMISYLTYLMGHL